MKFKGNSNSENILESIFTHRNGLAKLIYILSIGRACEGHCNVHDLNLIQTCDVPCIK